MRAKAFFCLAILAVWFIVSSAITVDFNPEMVTVDTTIEDLSIPKNNHVILKYSGELTVREFESRGFLLGPEIPVDGYIAFREAVAHKESRGMYSIVNSLGYMGKYQFGARTLRGLGYVSGAAFLQSPQMQERAFVSYLQYNKKHLQKYIDRYAGKTIAGVKVTESGILAAAHLGGTGGIKRFLRSAGTDSFRDAYGSSVRYYLKRFGGYDLSKVI